MCATVAQALLDEWFYTEPLPASPADIIAYLPVRANKGSAAVNVAPLLRAAIPSPLD